MSRAEASIAVAMSARLAWVTALSASVPAPSLRVDGEGDRLVERAAGEAERGGGDGDAEQGQRAHRDA